MDLRADIMNRTVNKVSNMWVEQFRISTPSIVYTYQQLCSDPILFCHSRRAHNLPEKKETFKHNTENTLSNAYTATLIQLRAQKEYKSVLRLAVLMWRFSVTSLGALSPPGSEGTIRGSVSAESPFVVETASMSSKSGHGPGFFVPSLVHFTLREHLPHHLTLFHSTH